MKPVKIDENKGIYSKDIWNNNANGENSKNKDENLEDEKEANWNLRCEKIEHDKREDIKRALKTYLGIRRKNVRELFLADEETPEKMSQTTSLVMDEESPELVVKEIEMIIENVTAIRNMTRASIELLIFRHMKENDPQDAQEMLDLRYRVVELDYKRLNPQILETWMTKTRKIYSHMGMDTEKMLAIRIELALTETVLNEKSRADTELDMAEKIAALMAGEGISFRTPD